MVVNPVALVVLMEGRCDDDEGSGAEAAVAVLRSHVTCIPEIEYAGCGLAGPSVGLH